MPIHQTYIFAILWALASTGLFTVIFAAAKFADGNAGTFQIQFLRYIGASATVIVLALNTDGLRSCISPKPHLHFVRAVFGCFAAVAITWSSARMPIADATAIGMLYGILTVFLGIVFLNEHVGLLHWLAIIISLSGAGIVVGLNGAFTGGFDIWPSLAAFASALLLAAEGVLIRVLSLRERTLAVLLHVNLFGILLMAWPAFSTWQEVDLTTMIGCLGLGPLAILAQYCTIRAYRLAPLSVVGPVDYSWLIFAALLGLLVFGEEPSTGIYLGGSLIIMGGVLLSVSGRRQTGAQAHKVTPSANG
ncbi:DMT family transporter [Coralliovum pocilloporae]|uniref:DMT family transporter n=1 Tax=Coralliovum pocilloporae TaxID=3066369 RepID=UPI003306C3EC